MSVDINSIPSMENIDHNTQILIICSNEPDVKLSFLMTDITIEMKLIIVMHHNKHIYSTKLCIIFLLSQAFKMFVFDEWELGDQRFPFRLLLAQISSIMNRGLLNSEQVPYGIFERHIQMFRGRSCHRFMQNECK